MAGARAGAAAVGVPQSRRPRRLLREQPLLLTVQDAAAALASSIRKVHQLVYDGELATVRIGRSLRFRRVDLEALAAAHLSVAAPRGGSARRGQPGPAPPARLAAPPPPD